MKEREENSREKKRTVCKYAHKKKFYRWNTYFFSIFDARGRTLRLVIPFTHCWWATGCQFMHRGIFMHITDHTGNAERKNSYIYMDPDKRWACVSLAQNDGDAGYDAARCVAVPSLLRSSFISSAFGNIFWPFLYSSRTHKTLQFYSLRPCD